PLAVQLAATNHYDAVVLDIMLPGMDGYEVCNRLRNQLGLGMPVLMLTARDTLDDKLTGFDSGADDYLVKPFELKELEARIHALIRRQRGELENSTLTIGDLQFNTQTMQVSRAGQLLKLSPTGLKILRLLMRESPKLVTREQIEMEVWGDDTPDSDALRSHLYSLRKAIDKPFEKQLLHTIPGVGFKLCDQLQNEH
ncbi:MAG: response regulator transcription factor, partial [Porticoccaceae bacterium]|nr:response regulator transcription factor [Porticoccaceae bacterium]